MMKMKEMNFKDFELERKSFDELDDMQKMSLYLHNHKKVLSQELMKKVAEKYMNYAYIRKRIKQLYPQVVMTNLKEHNFVLIPEKDE